MLEHGVHRVKQLDGGHDQRLLGRFALGLLAEINGAPLATTAHGIDGGEVERPTRRQGPQGREAEILSECVGGRAARAAVDPRGAKGK